MLVISIKIRSKIRKNAVVKSTKGEMSGGGVVRRGSCPSVQNEGGDVRRGRCPEGEVSATRVVCVYMYEYIIKQVLNVQVLH